MDEGRGKAILDFTIECITLIVFLIKKKEVTQKVLVHTCPQETLLWPSELAPQKDFLWSWERLELAPLQV
jgi:hypothetical protein